jgi:hypothetical protein
MSMNQFDEWLRDMRRSYDFCHGKPDEIANAVDPEIAVRERDLRVSTLIEAARLICEGCRDDSPIHFGDTNCVSHPEFRFEDGSVTDLYCQAEAIILRLMKI